MFLPSEKYRKSPYWTAPRQKRQLTTFPTDFYRSEKTGGFLKFVAFLLLFARLVSKFIMGPLSSKLTMKIISNRQTTNSSICIGKGRCDFITYICSTVDYWRRYALWKYSHWDSCCCCYHFLFSLLLVREWCLLRKRLCGRSEVWWCCTVSKDESSLLTCCINTQQKYAKQHDNVTDFDTYLTRGNLANSKKFPKLQITSIYARLKTHHNYAHITLIVSTIVRTLRDVTVKIRISRVQDKGELYPGHVLCPINPPDKLRASRVAHCRVRFVLHTYLFT